MSTKENKNREHPFGDDTRDKIRQLVTGGSSLRETCAALMEGGYLTPRGSRQWWPSSVQSVLKTSGEAPATAEDEGTEDEETGTSDQGGEAPTATRRSVAEKFGKRPIPATHVGILEVNGLKFPCANLKGGLRVISQRAFYLGLGASYPGGRKAEADDDNGDLPVFLQAKNLTSFIPAGLTSTANLRILYKTPHERVHGSGALGVGIDARLIPEICNVWLKARDAKKLHYTQIKIAEKADILIRGLAVVGIVALVDAATGYERDRAANELQAILDAYVRPEFRRCLPIFSSEFFSLIYGLHGWVFKEGQHHHPGYVGTLINDWIYRRLPTPVLPELDRVNPRVNGRRRHKKYWWLTEETGKPHAERQLAVIMALLRAARGDKARFQTMLVDACPVQGDQTILPFPEPEGGPPEED